MTTDQLRSWLWIVGIAAVLGSLLLLLRRRPCVHDLEEIDSVPNIVRLRCKKCGKEVFQKIPTKESVGANNSRQLIVPTLEFSPGAFYCLHIPQKWENQEKPLIEGLLKMSREKGLKAVVCHPAGAMREDGSGIHTSRSWLAHATGITEKKADEIIAELPILIENELRSNAGTPRSILGIAAGLAQTPDVVIYDATALDEDGCRTVHHFVNEQCRNKTVIHLSYPHYFGDGRPRPRNCPEGARCVDLRAC